LGVIPGEQGVNHIFKRQAGAKYARYIPVIHDLVVDPEKAGMGELVNIYIQGILVWRVDAVVIPSVMGN